MHCFSIFFIDTVYPEFLKSLHNRFPQLPSLTYEQQSEFINSCRFGDSDYYTEGFRKAGWVANQTVVNSPELQAAWAAEQGIPCDPNNSVQVIVEHLRKLRPDVVYFQNLGLACREVVEAIRPFVQLIVGQIASEIPPQTYLKGFDALISSLPLYVKNFRQQGIASFYVPLGFESKILDEVRVVERDIPLSFVGGLASQYHSQRKELIEKIIIHPQIEFYGYGYEQHPSLSAYQNKIRGEAWGREMFEVLGRSKLTINIHADFAGDHANNMRLFEATGMGTLLITDYKSDLQNLFDIGSEVVAYRSSEECLKLIDYYLSNPQEARAIAERGQRRTLRDHTYAARATSLAENLEFLLTRRNRKHTDTGSISKGYESHSVDQISDLQRNAWKSEDIPYIQRVLVDSELGAMYQNTLVAPYKIMVDALATVLRSNDHILEVGCASGYYYEVLKYNRFFPALYTGVDFSTALIRLARECYPRASFYEADGGCLRYNDREFDIGISSGVILHVENYAEHIKEICRVSKKYAILHRTPLCKRRGSLLRKKTAYGHEMFEYLFNWSEIMQLVESQNFILHSQLVLSEHPAEDEYHMTFVFSRVF